MSTRESKTSFTPRTVFRPGPCCITGVVSSAEATGTVITIDGLNTYIAKPDGNAKGLVVIIPDEFGWDLSNSRVLADKLAKKGQFLVYLPDFMIVIYNPFYLDYEFVENKISNDLYG